MKNPKEQLKHKQVVFPSQKQAFVHLFCAKLLNQNLWCSFLLRFLQGFFVLIKRPVPKSRDVELFLFSLSTRPFASKGWLFQNIGFAANCMTSTRDSLIVSFIQIRNSRSHQVGSFFFCSRLHPIRDQSVFGKHARKSSPVLASTFTSELGELSYTPSAGSSIARGPNAVTVEKKMRLEMRCSGTCRVMYCVANASRTLRCKVRWHCAGDEERDLFQSTLNILT